MLSLSIKNDLADTAMLEPFVESVCGEFQLDAALSFPLHLVLDEAVSNVINYAYGDATGMPVLITAAMAQADDRRQLVLTVYDEGVPFNPLEEAPDVDVSLGIEEREVGGLGIFLIRQTMDEVRYERQGNRNVLVMIKYV